MARRRQKHHRVLSEVEDLDRRIFMEGSPIATKVYVQTCSCGASRTRFQSYDPSTDVPYGKPEDCPWLDQEGNLAQQ